MGRLTRATRSVTPRSHSSPRLWDFTRLIVFIDCLDVHPKPGVDLSDHADLLTDMSTQTNHERPSRNIKSENRLYTFLSRSRSRSRPKVSTQKSSQDASGLPDSPDSKPSARIASRPLSSTTTATNATVTPGTPKARPQLLAPIIVPQRPSTGLAPQIPPRPATAKPSNARKKLHILFGISLSSPKKSSFTASQLDSSRSSLDMPPLPTRPLTPNPASKRNRSFSRSHSPNTLSKMRQNGARLSSSLTDISNAQCAGASTMFHKIFSGSKGIRAPDKPPILVSGPIRHSSQHRSTSSESRRPTTDKRLRGHEASHSLPGSSLPPPPHIICTPATPDRRAAAIASLPSPNAPDTRKISMDSTSRSRKGKEREASVQQHPTKAEAKSAKRHSLDFEGPSIATATGGSESGLSRTSEWNRHAESAVRERESTFGPGLAGVGTLQRDMSLKRGKEREEHVRAREAERKQLFQQQRKHKHDQPSSQDVPTVQIDHANGSTSTVATGHSSSWGRATGKKSALSGRIGSGTGLPKLSTLTQHPAFDFEPPVPSSTPRNTSSIGTLHDASSSCDKAGEEGKQGQKPGSTEEGRPVPILLPASLGHRSALKGRSLDLGLGLAWAPSSVREEVLLPVLNVRSFSQSSSASGSHNTGKSASSNSHGNAKRDAIYEEPDNAEVSKLGKEVPAVFKNTLDHDGFVNFRKYVHQFYAHEIPFDGPTGIITRVEQLLGESSSLRPHEKRQLMDQLIRIILRNA
ncbi:hypothetical protein APHAL10511_001722 [Amanita phalloides]|nr:hypothetical protein APHAL10511_001722 [Amanita phalloides]